MANISFAHASDHAVVLILGELDWDASHELVSTIETVVDHYFYTEVELVIASPGGSSRALKYYLNALRHWQSQGVRFRTRVISSAASAGAFMVSLGDERIAEPGARLMFHHARAHNANDLTASATTELHSFLRQLDEHMIALLAERALAVPADIRNVPFQSERSDREVIERLHAGLKPGNKKKPGKRRLLARTIGRAVDRACRDGDLDGLKAIYRHLFEVETPISARLARTLRLIDRIGSRSAEDIVVQGTPGLTIPEWRVLYPPSGDVPREVLTRHTLVLGETGAGKTASCMLPVVAALARTPPKRLGGALVIDPKLELGPVLERLAPERLHHITADRAVVNLMAGPRWSLEADFEAGRWQSAALRILCRVASFVRSSPARVLMDHMPGSDNDEFFAREGTSLALAVLTFVLIATSPDAGPPEQWLADDVEAYLWVDELLARARGTPHERGPNALALAAWALQGPLAAALGEDGVFVLSSSGSTSRTWLFARIAKARLDHCGDEPGEARDVLRRILEYWEPMARVRGQYAGVRASASIICADFAAPAIASTLYFGCEPGYRAETHNGLDFAHLVSADGPGTLVLFQPARDGLDNLVAVALKAAFFEAVLDNPDRARGGKDLPLLGYVADEFHRFITSDPLHGEQSFLDTCRSFGAFCVLASQSVASLEHALAHGGGGYRQDESAVEILWNNTASKIIFRSTDTKTADRVADLCPLRPGLAGVVRVRPVSTLRIGECYAALADGRFERRQLAAYDPSHGDPSQRHSVSLLIPSEHEERPAGRSITATSRETS